MLKKLSVSDVAAVRSYVKSLESVYSSVMNSEIKATIDDTLVSTLTAVDDVTDTMKGVEKLVLIPQTLNLQLTEKIRLFNAQFNQAKNIVVDSYNLCKFFETVSSNTNSGIAENIVNPVGPAEESVGFEIDDELSPDQTLLPPDYVLKKRCS